jgi:hypothetical protein
LRGVGTELKGGLIGGRAEVCQKVANLFLAGVDDLTGRCLVDSGRHIVTQSREVAAELIQKGLSRHQRFRGHAFLLMAR